MEKSNAVAALSALAQDNRLDVFRLLVQAGPDGIPAGGVAAALGLAPNTLTFHFDRLRQAGLVTVRRNGRSMIYAAQFETMNAVLAFLTELLRRCAGEMRACASVQARAGQAHQSSHLKDHLMKRGVKAYRVLKILDDDMNVQAPGVFSACCTE